MPQLAPITTSLQHAFSRLIAEGTGWQVKPKDHRIFEQKIKSRMAALTLTRPENYYQLLTAHTPESQQEWQNLIALLSNPESFFFRDRGQFEVLRRHVLPDLIQRHQTDKQLRILSAGCSTGEEPYSLALLLKEIIPDLDQWNLTLLGTDINMNALRQATEGIYRPWSLRGIDDTTKQQYFRLINGQYHLNADIKKMVRFRALNLVGKTLSQPNAQLKIDLIICRNVFIYFRQSAIASVIKAFHKMLRPSGYLVAGHTELWNQDMSLFEAQSYPESLVYRRPDLAPKDNASSLHQTSVRHAPVRHVPVRHTPVRPEDKSAHEQTLLKTAITLFKSHAFEQAMHYAEESLKIQPKNFDVLCLMAQLQLETGQLETAAQYCHQASEIKVFSVVPYYTLAQVLKRQGDMAFAKRIFKKIIYLEPNSVAAYIELSALYRQEGNTPKSVKMRRFALNLLRKLPANTQILELDNLTVAEILLKL